MRQQKVGVLNGQDIWQITLENEYLAVRTLNFGAVIQNLWLKKTDGSQIDIVLGFDDWQSYVDQKFYLGCTIGRCSNRIVGAEFALNGQEYRLDANEGENHLHGGANGFWNRVWRLGETTANTVTMQLYSPAGDQGYPGALNAQIHYILDGCDLHLQYQAVSEEDTVISLTNHSYFNLAGQGSGICSEHNVTIHADYNRD